MSYGSFHFLAIILLSYIKSVCASIVHLVAYQRARDISLVICGILLLSLHFSPRSPHFRGYVFVFIFFSFPTHVAF